jgi:hypothetical protein
MTAGVASLTCVLLLGAAADPVPRLVLALHKAPSGKLALEVENAGAQPLVLSARTYLVLLDPDTGGAQAPRYWAEIKTPGLPSSSTPMKMTGRQRVRLTLEVGALMWTPDRSGMSAGHPLARAVPPGEYELQVQIVDERDVWWRSSGVPVRISRGGGLAF